MKSSLSALGLLLSIAATGGADAASLTVDIGNRLKPGETLMVAVYDDANSWLKKPLRAIREAAPAAVGASGRHQLTLEGLPPGRYALSVYVDRNGNGKLDRGMFGIPSEPYGFSQGGGSMGPPDFSDAAVELTEADATIPIKLR
ncbi:MAG: DUF2141 domain-containing protein [Lysobacterales bacterium]